AEDGIRDWSVTGVQTCALPIWPRAPETLGRRRDRSVAGDRVTARGPGSLRQPGPRLPRRPGLERRPRRPRSGAGPVARRARAALRPWLGGPGAERPGGGTARLRTGHRPRTARQHVGKAGGRLRGAGQVAVRRRAVPRRPGLVRRGPADAPGLSTGAESPRPNAPQTEAVCRGRSGPGQLPPEPGGTDAGGVPGPRPDPHAVSG